MLEFLINTEPIYFIQNEKHPSLRCQSSFWIAQSQQLALEQACRTCWTDQRGFFRCAFLAAMPLFPPILSRETSLCAIWSDSSVIWAKASSCRCWRAHQGSLLMYQETQAVHIALHFLHIWFLFFGIRWLSQLSRGWVWCTTRRGVYFFDNASCLSTRW